MTTKVTVDAHAGWPVEVTTRDLDEHGARIPGQPQTVAPNTVQEFYIHSHRELLIKEMPNG